MPTSLFFFFLTAARLIIEKLHIHRHMHTGTQMRDSEYGYMVVKYNILCSILEILTIKQWLGHAISLPYKKIS